MRRFMCALLALLLLAGICLPQNAEAATTTVKIKYKGSTHTYAKKMTKVYVNGKKVTLTDTPVFLKSGSYVGPANEIFKKSPLKISYTDSSKKYITFKYNKKTLKLTNGSLTAVVNGKTDKNAMGSTPMRSAVYKSSGKSRWIVPLKSVCNRLGLTYELKSNGVIYISDAAYVKSQAAKTAAKTSTAAATTVAAATTAAKTSTTTTGASAKKFVLVLDAGHGGTDSGALGNGYAEKNMTLSIVLGAKKYFDKDSRFQVYYTRTSDTYPSLSDRSNLANNKKADIFISVHINSASATATGTETLYNNDLNTVTMKNGITSKSLATAMQKAAVKSTGFSNRGLVNRTGLHVLRKTNMPSCLIEYGFISNTKEAKLMHANTTRYGKELYEAIAAYLKAQGKIS